MFKFLFRSKFSGFVEAPVGVFFVFPQIKKKMHVKPTFFELQILVWMSVFDSKNQANPKFETQVAYLGQTQPKLVTGIFIIVFIISFITID